MTLSDPIYFEYDMAISFAGEDRVIAEDLAEALSNKGVEVFYDKSFKIALLGRELADVFRGIYASKSRFAVVLISRNYLGKNWTNFEFSIIREQAKKRKSEFILPVRLDDTNMFGIPTEGNGVSNNIRNRMGPPKFRQAVFKIDRPSYSIAIKMQY